MKRTWAFVISLLVSVALVGPASPAAAAPYCGIYWGSLAKTVETYSSAPMVDVRTGRHACYDRLVIDVAGAVKGYRVEYVPNVYQEGSGALVPLRGGAKLRVTALVPAYENGHATYAPANPNELTNVTGYQTFRQLAWAGTFEGQSTIGLGVRARLPFRVFILAGPGTMSRLVIDVAHYW